MKVLTSFIQGANQLARSINYLHTCNNYSAKISVFVCAYAIAKILAGGTDGIVLMLKFKSWLILEPG